MTRRALQHITLQTKAKNFQPKNNGNYLTAEDIKVKSNYSKEDIKDLGHLDFVAGIAPNLRGPYST
ncbi:hypothetical protein, partial [Winogradskyella sp.]